jgi:3-phytase
VKRLTIGIAATVLLSMTPGAVTSAADKRRPVVVDAVVTTAPLFNYEDAPATPDADDPAVWIDRRQPNRSLVIGTAKDAGLLVYDLAGRLVQAIRPPNAPHVSPMDPPTPTGVNAAPDNPCTDSDEGETFGRFNNVDIAYDVRLGTHPRAAKADVAVVSDRGCDHLRFYKIDLSDPDGPLVDVTAANVPRVFPTRYDQPSPLQPSGAVEGWRDSPLDDQNTVYGLTVAQRDQHEVFVTERERGLVRQLRIVPTASGHLTYRLTRTYLFDTSFTLRNERGGRYAWTPCREAAQEEPQSEGVVFDSANDTLYVAFETIGLYKLRLRDSQPAVVTVGADRLIEPVNTFGRPYHATPDDDEFECTYDPDGAPAPEDVVAEGSAANAGAFLQADLEGLSVIASVPGQTLMLASSQGDSSFHFYRIDDRAASHLGSFFVAGVGETDGVHYAPVPLGHRYPLGLLVVQNGQAPEPADTGPINGFELDGSTQFTYVNFADTLRALLRGCQAVNREFTIHCLTPER